MTDRAAIAEASLERLAEAKGDITVEVIDHYYRACPDARASFEFHGLDNVAELEGRMVSETVFFLMQWAADPATTKISQGTTICHHQDTLEIGPRWYLGLIDAVLEVLWETIPASNATEREMWLAIRTEAAEFIDSLRPEFVRTDTDGVLPPFAAT